MKKRAPKTPRIESIFALTTETIRHLRAGDGTELDQDDFTRRDTCAGNHPH